MLGAARADITDNGSNNTFWNVLATSACSSCSSVQPSTTGEDFLSMGVASRGVAGQSNGMQITGNNATSGTDGSATALPANPQGYIVEQFLGHNVKVPYYLKRAINLDVDLVWEGG